MGFKIRQVIQILQQFNIRVQKNEEPCHHPLLHPLGIFQCQPLGGRTMSTQARGCHAPRARYLGDWYSVYETPMPYTTQENTCNRYQYGPLPQGVNNISLYMTTTRADSSIGEAPCAWMQPVTPMNPTGDVLLYMGEVGSPSWIIDTDYEPFSASYSCEEGLFGHYKNAAIFTRDPSAPQEAVDKAFAAFDRNGLDLNDWFPVVHTEDCVYDTDHDRWCKSSLE